jgi:hypothetical protein
MILIETRKRLLLCQRVVGEDHIVVRCTAIDGEAAGLAAPAVARKETWQLHPVWRHSVSTP